MDAQYSKNAGAIFDMEYTKCDILFFCNAMS